MLIEKNGEYVVEIIDNGYDGEGIAKIDEFAIFIPGAIKGEVVKIVVVKVLSYAFGKIIDIIKSSDKRIDSDCSTYKRCGGCNLRHIEYDETLKMKNKIVKNLINKKLDESIHIRETIGMNNPYYYRNKAQYPVGYDKDNKLIYGAFAR